MKIYDVFKQILNKQKKNRQKCIEGKQDNGDNPAIFSLYRLLANQDGDKYLYSIINELLKNILSFIRLVIYFKGNILTLKL